MNERSSTRTTSKAVAMSSCTAVQDDFTTPDRSKAMLAAAANGHHGHHHHHRHHNSTEEKKEDRMNSSNNTTNDNINSSTNSTLVTPSDSFSTAAANRKENAAAAARAAASKKKNTTTTTSASSVSTSTSMIKQEDNKLVRFDNNNNNKESTAAAGSGTTEEICSVGSADGGESSSSLSPTSSSKLGLVSRRGRSTSLSSPGSRSLVPPPIGAIPSKEAAEAAAAVLEFKTFRSPERRYQKETKDDENSEESNNNSNSVGSSIHPPNSSLAPRDNTSTKASGDDTLPKKKSSTAATLISTTSAHNTSSFKKSSNVTFSPVPLPRISGDKFMKTPIKSPTGGRFTSLPTLDDDALGSPGAIFLSPTRTPTYFHHIDRNATTTTNLKDSAVSAIGSSTDSCTNVTRAALPLTPRTPKYGAGGFGGVGDQLDGGRLLATPTDFAYDYGKNTGTTPGSLLDTSNVLAWLHSPTANGLFSPGGLGSMLNTPRAGGTGSILRTPHTPTFSTSFFFSDVAGLPRGDCASPTKSPAKSHIGVAAAAGGGATATNASDPGGKQRGTNNGRGNNNIICISPLSSYHKSKNGPLGPNSPKINYKDMFASPAERSGMAMLGRKAHGGTTGGVQRGGNLDAVHLAERDLMEDEDLSVLLQLASSTPRPAAAVSGGSGISTNDRTAVTSSASTTTAADGTTVFRSSSRDGKNGENENLPSLQLPIIGDQAGDVQGTTLTRKIHSRDHYDNMTDDRGIRPIHQTSGGSTVGTTKNNNASDNGYTPPITGSMQHPAQRSAYPMPTHFPPHHESPYYPSLHPAMTHGGSMRVIVGGPPPNRGGKSSGDSSQRVRTYTIGPRGEYPPPPYPPPPSHYPHHRPAHPPPHAHLHPHYSRYPPPPPPHPHSHSQNAHRQHMPLYGGAPPTKAKTGKKQSLGKTTNTSKTGVKRPATTSAPKAPPSAKKAKKPSSQSAPKKKNRSPPLVDKAERLAAAATIEAVNQASGGKNNKAAALAAAILRGVTMRPSGKWQAQLYFAGKSRYIGVFDTREKAALAYEIAREKLKSEKSAEGGGVLSPKRTEAAVNAARKAAFEGVNERDPRLAGK